MASPSTRSSVQRSPLGTTEESPTMAKVRLNKVIDLLEHGQTVFSCGTVPNGNYDDILAVSRSAYDMIILETEHVGFDFPTLRHSLQYLLNRKRIAEKGSLQPDVEIGRASCRERV